MYYRHSTRPHLAAAHRSPHSARIAILILAAFFSLAAGPTALAETPPFADKPAFDPTTLFLTWQDDPTTTMTIQWLGDRNWSGLPEVWYAPHGSDDWKKARAFRTGFPRTPLFIYRANLRSLSPGTDYVFRIGLSSPEYRFRTMPETMPDRLIFATGGDAGPGEPNRKTCIAAASHELHFALIGGDLAYANGENPNAWIEWLEDWKTYMETPQGRMVPMLVTIGNHEVQGGFSTDHEKAPFFYSLFKLFSDNGYTALDFGDYLSLILLDSGHTTAVAGDQTTWLAKALEERAEAPNLFVTYHVPAYPVHRDFNSRGRADIREHWTPLIEQHRPAAVFENDDHAYKRSVLIRDGKEDPQGVLYLGDGCWGREPRAAKTAENTWYIKESAEKVHFILVEIDAQQRRYRAIDNNRQTFDEFVQPR